MGPTLTKRVDYFSVNFQKHLEAYNITQPEKDLSMNWKMHFSLWSPGYREVSFNVIKECLGSLHKPLLHIFNVSLQNGTFPDELKIARVTPLFKNRSDSGLGNYRPVPVLPCFSKILEKSCKTVFINIWLIIMFFTRDNLAFKKALNRACHIAASWPN